MNGFTRSLVLPEAIFTVGTVAGSLQLVNHGRKLIILRREPESVHICTSALASGQDMYEARTGFRNDPDAPRACFALNR